MVYLVGNGKIEKIGPDAVEFNGENRYWGV